MHTSNESNELQLGYIDIGTTITGLIWSTQSRCVSTQPKGNCDAPIKCVYFNLITYTFSLFDQFIFGRISSARNIETNNNETINCLLFIYLTCCTISDVSDSSHSIILSVLTSCTCRSCIFNEVYTVLPENSSGICGYKHVEQRLIN
jgi:hypothetical protein